MLSLLLPLLLLPLLLEQTVTQCNCPTGLTQPTPYFPGCARLCLAVRDFNARNCDVMTLFCSDATYADCPFTLHFTTGTPVSDQESATVATNILLDKYDDSCAVTGPSWSSLTLPLATITGAVQLPQIGYAATSIVFDDKTRYSTYARIITADSSIARFSVEYVQSIGVGFICVVYVEDEWGTNFNIEFGEAARDNSLPHLSFVHREGVTSLMSEAGCQNIFGVLHSGQFEDLIPNADANGLLGSANFWLFADGVSQDDLIGAWPKSKGMGVITATGYLEQSTAGVLYKKVRRASRRARSEPAILRCVLLHHDVMDLFTLPPLCSLCSHCRPFVVGSTGSPRPTSLR